MMSELSSNKNISKMFAERSQKLGFTPDQLFFLMSSLQDQRYLSPSDKKNLQEILSKSPGFKNLSELPAADIYLLDKILSQAIDTDILGAENTPSIRRLGLMARYVFFSVLGIVMIAFLIYALVSGYSTVVYFQGHGILALISVCMLIFFLFLLEGTQISITSLRLKDIEAIDGVKENIKALHANYRNANTVQKYLAGRQLLTIVTVFFISRICSFPELAIFPVIGGEIPGWFRAIFLDFGILAALVTLWLGQLAPQFWANRQPISFLSMPLSKFVIYLSRFIEMIGITDFGSVIISRLTHETSIPPSNREMYHSYKINYGYAASGIIVKYDVDGDQIHAEVSEDFVFDKFNQDRFLIEETFPINSDSKDVSFNLYQYDQKQPAVNEGIAYQAIEKPGKLSYLIDTGELSLATGDILVKKVRFDMEYQTQFSGLITLPRPAKYLFLTLSVKKKDMSGEPWVQAIHQNVLEHETAGNRTVYQMHKVHDEAGVARYAVFIPFPHLDSFYNFYWEE